MRCSNKHDDAPRSITIATAHKHELIGNCSPEIRRRIQHRTHHVREFSEMRQSIREYVDFGSILIGNKELAENVPSQEVATRGQGVPVAEHLKHCEMGSLEH